VNSETPRASTELLILVTVVSALASLLTGTLAANLTTAVLPQIGAGVSGYLAAVLLLARLFSTHTATTVLGSVHIIVAVVTCLIILGSWCAASVAAAGEHHLAAAAEQPSYGTNAARSAATARATTPTA
jgi:hypothetical protein